MQAPSDGTDGRNQPGIWSRFHRKLRYPRLVPLILILLGAGRFGLPEAGAHAKPGAHADVRFSISRSAVRVEALMNLRFVEGLVNWSLEVRDEVAPAEESAGKRVLLDYFGGPRAGLQPSVLNRPNAVTIDGIPTQPVLLEFRVIRPAPETRPGFVEVAQALWQQVWVAVEYPCKTPPRSVSFVWGTYPRDFLAADRDVAPLSEVEAILLADGETMPLIFRDREPEYVWHASGTPLEARFQKVPETGSAPTNAELPTLSVVIGIVGAVAGLLTWRTPARRAHRWRSAWIWPATVVLAFMARPYGRTRPPSWWRQPPPLPTPAEALAIFQPLHANIYRAFDYTTESEIYDALARSVDGPLLGKTYDDIYRSLILQEEGGALCRVKSVLMVQSNVETVTRDPQIQLPVVTVDARWRVEGVVYHWGHSHARVNEYRARYTVAAGPAGWRIVGVEPLEQRRVDPERTETKPVQTP
jgi:hypothetical protein